MREFIQSLMVYVKLAFILYIVSEGPDQPIGLQSDQSIHCLLTESLDINVEYIIGKQIRLGCHSSREEGVSQKHMLWDSLEVP